jgi:hypothetical protein
MGVVYAEFWGKKRAEVGGREGIRTPDLLVANEENKFIRRGAATTYVS